MSVFSIISIIYIVFFVLFIKNPEILSVLAISYLALVVYGSFRISSNIYLKVKCFSRTFRKGLLLTFDDGPDPVNTQKILEILEKKNVRALFFITGSKAQEAQYLVKMISEKGHLTGNHSYSHSNFFPFYFRNTILAELQKTSGIIEDITGKKIFCFRPPFGVTNPGIAYAVRKLNYKTVGWSVRSLDTFWQERDKILMHVLKKISGGDIILFHDTVNGTVEMLDEFIDNCRLNGFEFIEPERFLPED
ncbi:MAG TPA: polysaccharide deacetylase family protein [bacterium]|nr:polysaccharide deacetylase family protein [bacterium]HPS30559.1 polysaccharide deacetylase family protein [bacterium]